MKYQVRTAIWHTDTSKAALIPPTITKSHYGENGLIVKSRRYFHSVNFLTSGDHSWCSYPFGLCDPLPPPIFYLPLWLFLPSAGSTSLFLWSSNDWFPIWGSLIFYSLTSLWKNSYKFKYMYLITFLFIIHPQIHISRPDQSSELWYPTTSWISTLVHLIGNLKALLLFSPFILSFIPVVLTLLAL